MTGHVHQYDKKATRLTLAVLIPAGALTLIGLILLWPGKLAVEPWTGPPHRTGDVVTVSDRECTIQQNAPGVEQMVCGEASVRLNDGPDAGRTVNAPIPVGPGAPVVSPGDRVILVFGDSFNDPTGTR